MLPVASAQIKSCVLLAGLLAEGETTVVEPEPSRDHTERLLAAAGAGVHREGDRITVGTATICGSTPSMSRATRRRPPSTPPPPRSSPAPRCAMEGMAGNWTRIGFFRILERMGATLRGEGLETRATAAAGRRAARRGRGRSTARCAARA